MSASELNLQAPLSLLLSLSLNDRDCLLLFAGVGGGTGVRADERLGDPPPRWIQEPLVASDRMEDP